MRATILGAGVSGLTTATALLEAGWDVHVVGREAFESTVSMVAAAVWTPTELEPQRLTRGWALTSRKRFAALALDDPESGVGALRQWKLETRDPGPTWWETTPHVRRIASDQLPAGYAAGFEIDGFMVEPPLYLHWLTDRVLALGGSFERADVRRLEDLEGDLVVNCAGLGAATLVPDSSLVPIRGQVVVVANPGIRDGMVDESDPDRVSYVYPRSQEIILGGTRQVGETNPEPDPVTTDRILADCAALDPRVERLEIHDVRVGLRPGRPSVRVERDRLDDGWPLVHNYGHGGAGFILSWGCAGLVAELSGR